MQDICELTLEDFSVLQTFDLMHAFPRVEYGKCRVNLHLTCILSTNAKNKKNMQNSPNPSKSAAVVFELCSWLKRLCITSDLLVLGSRHSCPAGHKPSSSTSLVKTNGCSTSVTTLRRFPSTESPGLQRPPALPSPWPSPPLTPAPRPCPVLLLNPPTSPRIPPSSSSLPRVHCPTVTQAGWPRAPLFRLQTWNSWEDRTRERPGSTWIGPVAPVKEVLARNLQRQTEE